MPLPSQMPRTSRQASFRYKDRPRHRTAISLAVSALIVAGGLTAWWYWDAKQSQTTDDLSATRTEAAVIPTSEKIQVALGEPRGPVNPILERSNPSASLQSPVLGTNTPAPSTTPPPVSNPASATPGTATPGPGTQNTSPPTWSNPATGTTETAVPPVNETPVNTSVSLRDPAVQRLIIAADQSIAAGRQAEARVSLNRALHDPRASDADVEMLRARLTDLNQTLVFSPVAAPGDPLADIHTIQSGDRLVKLVNAYDLKVDWRLIQRVNKMTDPGRLRIGQKLKIVRGPFHAVVHKSDYRLDLYSDMTDPDGNRLFIRSFSVGLGEFNSTPLGKWVVRQSSKLVNPHWVNPRTGERFDANDPKNPIGEYWLGLTGIDPSTEVLSGYGIHGTIEPESIGHDASMGCVRMLSEDIALVYEMLVEGYSQVEIRP
jgi:hypothetical protein